MGFIFYFPLGNSFSGCMDLVCDVTQERFFSFMEKQNNNIIKLVVNYLTKKGKSSAQSKQNHTHTTRHTGLWNFHGPPMHINKPGEISNTVYPSGLKE